CCQAEDGIRDRNVTGVQTCALPISKSDFQADWSSECQQTLYEKIDACAAQKNIGENPECILIDPLVDILTDDKAREHSGCRIKAGFPNQYAGPGKSDLCDETD